ncbi:hypothetical protein IQ07DRAFT_512276 [Pyrenochaeta sp. DS3sAY3a]|nr:hypothetical protein IQ07DRAFT_512276 [Pyrenochaeta sp. DS3sAY3a]
MAPARYAKLDDASFDDESLEQQHQRPKPGCATACTRILSKIDFLRWPAVFMLLFGILICELSVLHRQPPSLQLSGEINDLVPNFSTEQKIFRADDRYASDHKTPSSINATKQSWIDLMPQGGGFLAVSSPTSHTLPPPMHFPQTGSSDIYALAVFHQLHCLMHISAFMDTLVMKLRNRDFALNEGEIGHNDHCFNYLRNALMCCGDTALEGQAQAEMFHGVAGTDGTGGMHVCRNYDQIVGWAEKMRVTDGKENLG